MGILFMENAQTDISGGKLLVPVVRAQWRGGGPIAGTAGILKPDIKQS